MSSAERTPEKKRTLQTCAFACLAMICVWAVPIARPVAGQTCTRAKQATAAAGLQTLRTHAMYAEYDEAEAAARTLLQQDLSALQRNEVLELLATAQLANGHEQEAALTMRTLYTRDPDHRLLQEDPSPPVIAAFARARDARPLPVVVDLQLSHSPSSLPDNAVLVRILARDNGSAVEDLILHYRAVPTSEQQQLDLPYTEILMRKQPNGVWEATVPSDRSRSLVQLYVEAVAPSRRVMGTSGSSNAPTVLHTPWPEGPPVARSSNAAVIWGLVASAVVLVGVGVGVGIALSQENPPQGSLGTIVLP